jgi:hypothetical protein
MTFILPDESWGRASVELSFLTQGQPMQSIGDGSLADLRFAPKRRSGGRILAKPASIEWNLYARLSFMHVHPLLLKIAGQHIDLAARSIAVASAELFE